METFTTVPGSMASLRGKVTTSISSKESSTMDTGKMTGSKALESKHGLTAHNTRAALLPENSMAQAR